MVWFENLDGQGQFGPLREITADVASPRSAQAVDLDGDDDLDVVVVSVFDLNPDGSFGKVTWYENTDGQGTWGEQQLITQEADVAWSLEVADLDADGDPDVIVGSVRDSEISWFQNTDGQGQFGPQQLISTQAKVPEALEAADLDGDGDLDILVATSSFDFYDDVNRSGRLV